MRLPCVATGARACVTRVSDDRSARDGAVHRCSAERVYFASRRRLGLAGARSW
jgi:hypothetical protein